MRRQEQIATFRRYCHRADFLLFGSTQVISCKSLVCRSQLAVPQTAHPSRDFAFGEGISVVRSDRELRRSCDVKRVRQDVKIVSVQAADQ